MICTIILVRLSRSCILDRCQTVDLVMAHISYLIIQGTISHLAILIMLP